jgi:hypothetical protein
MTAQNYRPEKPVEQPVKTEPIPKVATPKNQQAPLEPDSPVAKLTRLIKEAEPARRETEALYHQERKARAANVHSALKTGQGRDAFYNALGAMKGELPRAEFDAPEGKLQQSDVFNLIEQVRTTPKIPERNVFARITAFGAINKVLSGEIPTRGEISLLEKIYGPELAEAILSKRSRWAKFKENFWDVANVSRTFKTMLDFSAMLRQGGMLAVGESKAWIKSIKPMLKATFNDKNYLAIDEAIRTHPSYELAEDAGLYLAPVEEFAMLSAKEEAFVSRLIHKVPVLSGAVKMSERSYNTFLNSLRSDVFYKYVDQWGTNATEKDYSELAKFINAATGRGSLGSLENASHVMSSVFFSPRYFMSRIQAPLSLASSSPLARKVAAKNLVGFTVAGMTALGLIKAAGGKVEDDPRSSDFGKGRIGNTRIDLFTGYLPIVRYAAQLITAQRKNSDTGGVQDINRLHVLGLFGRSKLAPSAGFAVSALQGRNYVGEDYSFKTKNIGNMAYNEFTPMVAADIYEATKEQGPLAGLLVAPLTITGVGTTTYDSKKQFGKSTASPSFNFSSFKIPK